MSVKNAKKNLNFQPFSLVKKSFFSFFFFLRLGSVDQKRDTAFFIGLESLHLHTVCELKLDFLHETEGCELAAD